MPTPILPQSLDATVKKRENASLVRQSNDLIQRSHFDLSATEAKIWLYIVQQIKPSDTHLKPMEFRIRDFCKVIGINPNSGASYNAIRASLKNIADSSLYIDLEGNGDETLVRWLSSVKMSKKSGTATVEISPEMRPFLIELRERYTGIPMPYVAGLHSKYSIRLYQLLKSYEYLKAPVMVTIAELRKILELPDSYDWNKIKERILELSVNEIGTATDMELSYQVGKIGRSVAHVTFFMDKIPLEERDKRLSVVENRLGKDILHDVLYKTPSADIEYDEIFESPPKEKLESPLIEYASGSSKPIMVKTLRTKINYNAMCKELSEDEIDTLDLLIKSLASLSNKHGKGEILIDGGNKNNIDMMNAIIERYGSLKPWFEAVLSKYTTFFDNKTPVSNPIAYISKSVANDLFYADMLIKNHKKAAEIKPVVNNDTDNDFIKRALMRPRRLKNKIEDDKK